MKMMKYLTIIDAAKYLGRSTKTVRNYIKSGKLNAVMEDSPFGHRYVIPLEELQKMKDGDCPSDVKPVESILEVIQPNLPLEPVENMVIGVEKRLLEAMESRMEALEERLEERDRLLMEALERMEAKKKPGLFARLFRRSSHLPTNNASD